MRDDVPLSVGFLGGLWWGSLICVIVGIPAGPPGLLLTSFILLVYALTTTKYRS